VRRTANEYFNSMSRGTRGDFASATAARRLSPASSAAASAGEYAGNPDIGSTPGCNVIKTAAHRLAGAEVLDALHVTYEIMGGQFHLFAGIQQFKLGRCERPPARGL